MPDWVIVVLLIIAGLEVLFLIGLFAWWAAESVSYIRETDRQVQRELARLRAERRARGY